jgi:hypothetical protein
LSAVPRYLLVPAEKETAAEQLLQAATRQTVAGAAGSVVAVIGSAGDARADRESVVLATLRALAGHAIAH